MSSAIRVEQQGGVTVLVMEAGVNALDEALIAQLRQQLSDLRSAGAPALVLASQHPRVFCPGLDLKKLDGAPRPVVRQAMEGFLALLRELVSYPGPTVAAVAGHAIAGGCLIAMACDRRVMARSGARLGLSEVNLGIPVPAGAVAMLLALYPTRSVEQMVLEGDGYGGERALELGLVERLAAPSEVVMEAVRLARHMASRPQPAFQLAKGYLRAHLADSMAQRDAEHLEAFLDCWFAPETQDRLGAVLSEGRG
ncbi:MAG: enoyl-CoA hydratase/isomerase family protein [Thermoanaerobaculum sp.]|nr:enoyl-CoA hydratase/isomerase family protein [Thermoanaerobaculum sp.]